MVRSSSRGRFIRFPSEGEEHIIKAGLRQRELGDADATCGQLRQRLRHEILARDLGVEFLGLAAAMRFAEHGFQDGGGSIALRGISELDVQGAAADRGLELLARAFRNHLTVIDHRHAVGEAICFLHVLRGEQHRGAFGGDGVAVHFADHEEVAAFFSAKRCGRRWGC